MAINSCAPGSKFHQVVRHSSRADGRQRRREFGLVPGESFHVDVRIIARVRALVRDDKAAVADRVVFAHRQGEQHGLAIRRLEICWSAGHDTLKETIFEFRSRATVVRIEPNLVS